MSNGFYKYIAKRIDKFFSESGFKSGMRYCLKLDSSEMVSKVNDELQEWLEQKGKKGKYVYKSGVYETYTIRISDTKQVVVASKLKNITNDFLTTLRNEKLTENRFALLIIASSTIDSISSGVGDLSAKGMPFNSEAVKKDIENLIKNDDHFSSYEKAAIRFDLDSLADDKYTDKSSLFEYGAILSILDNCKLKGRDYPHLNLLADEDAVKIDKERDIKSRLKQNNIFFIKIDDAFKSGQIENALGNDFDDKFIKELKKKNKDDWYEDLTFTRALKSYEAKKESKKESLEIEDIFVYSEDDYDFDVNKNLWDIKDGKTSAKQRKTNLFIFNPEKKDKIFIEIKCNMSLQKSNISSRGIDEEQILSKGAKFCVKAKNVGFAEIKLQGRNNTSTNKQIIRICILGINSKYLDDFKTLPNKISIPTKIENSYIDIPLDGSSLCINPGEKDEKEKNLKKGNVDINCDFDETINLNIDGDFFNSGRKQAVTLNCGNVRIPLRLADIRDTNKVTVSGRNLFKLKYMHRDCFEYRSDGEVAYKNQAYFLQGEFRENIELEKKFIDEKCLALETETVNLQSAKKKDLQIPDEVKETYFALLDEYRNEKTLPGLAFYDRDKDLYKKALAYVESVISAFDKIEAGRALRAVECELLYLGCVFFKDECELETIAMSPLHPLNIAYQLELINETGFKELSNELIGKLTPLYLIPYIKHEGDELWKAVDQTHSMEWRYYKKFYKKQDRGSKTFVRKIVTEKIGEYRKHFSFLFDELGNNSMHINLVAMGDCKEILNGFIDYFEKDLKTLNINDGLIKLRVNIYSDAINNNYFYKLADFSEIKKHIKSLGLKKVDINELALALVNNIRCFYYKSTEKEYNYSHISFFEMNPKNPNSTGKMDNITTGISLGGLVSGVPSILDGDWFKTGFGFKYADANRLTGFAKKYNSLYRVARSSSAYNPDDSGFTEIENNDNKDMEKLFRSSNWIVFIDPHVDLSFFRPTEDATDKDLMIIHYNDQYSTSSGYDDITVTRKSKQYSDIIKEQFKLNNIEIDEKGVCSVIEIFNAVNGSWMLKLISNKKLTGAADRYFSREKLSILSAIKLSMAYFYDKSIVWVPISLEEIIRVSGGVGLSKAEGLLSAKNLGFPQGPACDDILLVGIGNEDGRIKLHIHPVEVKIGLNNSNVINKAKEQIKTTYKGFKNALDYQNDSGIETKLIRSYFIDIVIDACKKMKLYDIYPECDWDRILDTYRKELLNDEFDFSESHVEKYGRGSVVSFRSDAFEKDIDTGIINKFEFPGSYGFKYMIQDVNDIRRDLGIDGDIPDSSSQSSLCKDAFREDEKAGKSNSYNDVSVKKEKADKKEIRVKLYDNTVVYSAENKHSVADPVNVVKVVEVEKNIDRGIAKNEDSRDVLDADLLKTEVGNDDIINCSLSGENEKTNENINVDMDEHIGIEVNFGTDLSNGKDLIWNPNDTTQLFHTNTGIMGTMGTGKTQFTKSLITQLYRKRKNNYKSDKLGILIFDYKGDYNESNKDFINATEAKIFKPYHLPFNPLALTKSEEFTPLLPLHVANSFNDTLVKAYHLGQKQAATLLNCIISAYEAKGIIYDKSDTWNREAPTFDDVYSIYENDEEISKNDSLAAAMNKLKYFQIFESDASKTKTLYDILDGVVVIDLNKYDSDIQSTVVAITLDQFYAQMQAAGESRKDEKYREVSKMILVDEADNFMKEDYAVLRKILKEGRSFGVGTILSTQFLDHFITGEDDYSRYIMTWIVHKVDDLNKKDVEYMFNVEAKSDDGKKLFADIKNLVKHHSIVKIGSNSPYYIEDKPFWKLHKEMVERGEI